MGKSTKKKIFRRVGWSQNRNVNCTFGLVNCTFGKHHLVNSLSAHACKCHYWL